MAKVFKNNKGEVVITLTKEENDILFIGMQKAVEELNLMKNGEAMTDTDREYAEKALEGLSVIHDYYNPNNTVADIAERYKSPAVYCNGSKEYDELNNMSQPLWDAFLDELARYDLRCNYSNTYDTFTIG
jgi:hypothetical protein